MTPYFMKAAIAFAGFASVGIVVPLMVGRRHALKAVLISFAILVAAVFLMTTLRGIAT